MTDSDSNTDRNFTKIYNKTDRNEILKTIILNIFKSKHRPTLADFKRLLAESGLKNFEFGGHQSAACQSVTTKQKRPHDVCESAASKKLKTKEIITEPAQQNLEHDPHQSAASEKNFEKIEQKNPFSGPAQQNLEHNPNQSAANQRIFERIKHKNPWPYNVCESPASESSKTKQIRQAQQNLPHDVHQSAASQRLMTQQKRAKPEKISLPPHECHLCRRLKAKNKDEKSLQDVLNEYLSPNREFKYLNTPPKSDAQSDEPFIYVSRIINSGTRKIAIEAHDFEYDSITTIKLTRKDIVEQNISVYPCLKREFSINNLSNIEHVKNLCRNFETEEKEFESSDEEPDSLREESESLREERELQKRAEALCNKFIFLSKHLYENRLKDFNDLI